MKKILALLLLTVTAFADGQIVTDSLMSASKVKSFNKSISGTVSSGSFCISGLANTTNLFPKLFVHGPNIPTDTTIVAIPGTCSAGQVQMSNPAFGSGTNTILFGGSVSKVVDNISFDYNPLLQNLFNLKYGFPQVKVPNTIADVFSSSLGTLTNTIIGGGSLSLSGINTSGSYEINAPISGLASKIAGAANMDLQALAPKNTTIVSNVIVFSGDVTAYFPALKNVILLKQTSSGLGLQHTYLLNSFGNIAQLSVASATYSSGPDQTSVTLNNPQSLDLTMGLSSGSYNSTLRVVPFDYQFQTKTAAAQDYQNLTIKDAATTGILKIPGANYAISQCGYTGSVFQLNATISPNGNFILIRALENITSPKQWSWCYSKNGGASFTKFGTTRSNGVSVANAYNVDDELMNFAYLKAHDGQLICANNGKCFSTYPVIGAQYAIYDSVRAVYMDLSVGSPSLTDTPAIGSSDSISGADLSSTGYVASATGNNESASFVCGDLADLSQVGVLVQIDSNGLGMRWYSAGGATLQYPSSTTYTHGYSYPATCEMNGTSGSHRTIVIQGSPSESLLYRYWDEGSGTQVSSATINSTSAIILGTTSSMRSAQSGSRVHILYRDSTAARLRFATGTFNGSPSISDYALTNTQIDYDVYEADSSGGGNSQNRSLTTKVTTSPTDDKHVFLAPDVSNYGQHMSSWLYEIADSTAFVGNQFSVPTGAASIGLNDSSSRQRLAQTFIPNNSRIAAIGIHGWRSNSVPIGSTLTLRIENTTSNLPNGTVVATAVNTYDPSQATTSSSGEELWFNFNPALTVSTGTQYAIVLIPSYSTSGSNYWNWLQATSDVIASGTTVQYNGSSWSNQNGSSWDLDVDISTEWVTDFGMARATSAPPYASGMAIYEELSGLKFFNSSNAQWVTRVGPVETNTSLPSTGMPFRRTVSLGSGTTQSAISMAAVDGYNPSNYDKNVILEVSNGATYSGQKNILTGVVDNTKLSEDRSGTNQVTRNISNISYGADSDFPSGQAAIFNGSSSFVDYGNNSGAPLSFHFGTTYGFIAEAEIKPTSIGGGSDRFIIAQYNAGSSYGPALHINTSGYLDFVTNNSAGSSSANTTASDITEPTTCHLVRVWDDGTTTRLGRSVNCTSNRTIVEVASYSLQQRPIPNGSSAYISVGVADNGSDPFVGKIGCVKMAIGTSTFQYDGCKDQSMFNYFSNIGVATLASNRSGTNSTGLGAAFNTTESLAAAPNQAAVVDSYEDVFMWRESLPTVGSDLWFKILLNRGSAVNASSIPSYINRYSAP